MCFSLPTMPALFVLLAMAINTGVTVNLLGKRFGDWRFSWSYILGWVALLMTFFAGLFKLRGAMWLPSCWWLLFLEEQIIKSPIQHSHTFMFPWFYWQLFIMSYSTVQSHQLQTNENAHYLMKLTHLYDCMRQIMQETCTSTSSFWLLNITLQLTCVLSCRYILHVCLQNAWVQKSGWPTLKWTRNDVTWV